MIATICLEFTKLNGGAILISIYVSYCLSPTELTSYIKLVFVVFAPFCVEAETKHKLTAVAVLVASDCLYGTDSILYFPALAAFVFVSYMKN